MRRRRWLHGGIGAAVAGCAVACAPGCGAGPGHAAAGTPAAHLGSPAQRRLVAGPGRQAVARRYLVIARAGNRRLDASLGALAGRDRDRIGAARADLRDAAATERLFDRRLLRIAFPPGAGAAARRLYRVNQSRAALTAAVAAAGSLPALHAGERALTAANAPVEQSARAIRWQLGLPAPGS